MHEVDELELAPTSKENRRVLQIRLLPAGRLVIDPARLAVDLDPEPELAEVRPTVEVWPEESLDPTALGKGRKQRPVSEQCGWSWAQLPQGATFLQFGTVSLTVCVPLAP